MKDYNFKPTKPRTELWNNDFRPCDEVRDEIKQQLEFMQADKRYKFKLTLCRESDAHQKASQSPQTGNAVALT